MKSMVTWVEKIRCMTVGHDWLYNFMSIPNKRICSCCKLRQHRNLDTLRWIDGFKDERTDEELIKKWV